MTNEDYMINLLILFASTDNIKGPLIPCTKSRYSSIITMKRPIPIQ